MLNILIEVLIGFSVFGCFFGIFMNYYFTKYEVNLLGQFITKSVSFYKPQTPIYIRDIINNLDYIKDLKNEVQQHDDYVHTYNKPYDDKLITIIKYMIFIIILIIIFWAIFIKYEPLDLKYILTSIFLHIIFIVGFELLFLLYIITYINPVKLHEILA